MILALFGTNPYPFMRLFTALETLAITSGETIIVQSGHTPVSGSKLQCHPFVPHEQINNWLATADVAIVQGGFGSIRDCLRAGIPTIVVPRQPELGESMDKQSEIVDALAAESLVFPLYDVRELPGLVETVRTAPRPAPLESKVPALIADAVNRFMEP